MNFQSAQLPQIVRVETIRVYAEATARQHQQQWIGQGYEGAILRQLDAPYKPDTRSKALAKLKDFQDQEYVITGFKEASGNDAGTVIWECGDGDLRFHVRPKGTRAQRTDWFEHAREYIGQRLTVCFQEFTDDGLPRFPVGKAIRYIA